MACDGQKWAISGRPSNRPKNTVSAIRPVLRLTENGSFSPAGGGVDLNSSKPATAEHKITPICPIAVGHTSAAQAANRAMVTRGTSVQRLRAMPHTAWATTATATIFRPCSKPPGTAPPHAEMP
ncbi:hypothetical protein D3C81_1685820 [compost metagenome]